MSLSGGCRCGFLRYSVDGELAPVFHCHCGFCRHVHGASFTTVGFLSASAFSWRSTSGRPSRFVTPLGNRRHFCGRCASPIYNVAPSTGLACVIVPSLADPSRAMPWGHVNTESKAPWFEIQDRLPRFRAWPSPEELVGLASEHGARLPKEFGVPEPQVRQVAMASLFRKVDCLSLPVDDLDAALRFYRDSLGHELIWRDDTAAGLRLPDSTAELVLHTDDRPIETDLAVESVPEAIARFTRAGGSLVVEPFEIRIGLCAVVRDPWRNHLVILDQSKGVLEVDEERNVVGTRASRTSKERAP